MDRGSSGCEQLFKGVLHEKKKQFDKLWARSIFDRSKNNCIKPPTIH